MGRSSQLIPGAILAAVLAAQAVVSVRTWIHDWALDSFSQNPASARALSRLEMARRSRPGLDDSWRLEAEWLSASDLGRAQQLAAHATGLNPWSLEDWRVRATLAYQAGDSVAAHADLTRALAGDAGAQAHQVLANFAFLLGDMTTFWQQMKIALRVGSPADVAPILSLCLRAGIGRGDQLANLFAATGTPMRVAGVQYLLQAGQWEPALAIWRTTYCDRAEKQMCRDAVLPLAGTLVSRMQSGGDSTAQADATSLLSVWNQAVRDGVLDQETAKAGAITDPRFQHAWAGRALGWSDDAADAVLPPGVAAGFGYGGADLQSAVIIDLSRNVADLLPLFHQFVVAEPGHKYHLSFRIRLVETVGPQRGIVARVSGEKGKLLLNLEATADTRWATAGGDFQLPVDAAPLVAVQFFYQRPSGSPLLRGQAAVSQVSLESVGQP